MPIYKLTTENGIRVFHTAHKYCPSNIVLSTRVPTAAPLASATFNYNGTYHASNYDAVGFYEVRVNIFSNITRLINGTIESINSPAQSIVSDMFTRRYQLSYAEFQNCTSIGDGAFNRCSALTVVSFPACQRVGTQAFRRCLNLESAYFLGSSVADLEDVDAFEQTPFVNSSYLGYYGSFYVRADMLNAWKTATNWITYSDRFVGLSDGDIINL